jgi:hypothetical protein
MSDRFPTELIIGGPLSQDQLTRLAALLRRDGFSLEWAGPPFCPTGPEILDACQEDGLLHLYDHQRAGGDLENIAGPLRALGIPYDHRADGGYGLPPWASSFRPPADHRVHEQADAHGDLVCRRSELLGVRDLLRGHQPTAALALLERLLGPDLPPLRPLRLLGPQDPT